MKLINEVKSKNHWLGIPGGFVIGCLTGFVIGISGTFPTYEGGMTKSYNRATSTFLGLILGAVVGPVVGWIIGVNKVYQFH